MKGTWLLAVIALWTLWASPSRAQDEKKSADSKPEASWLALRGADIHTVTRGVVRGGTILVKDTKISEIGRDLELPEGTEVYDLAGLHIYPGLVALNASRLVGSRGKIQDTADPFNYLMTLALSGGITTAKQGRVVVKLVRGDLEGMVLREGVGVDLARTYSYNPSMQGREKLRVALRKARTYIAAYDQWAARQRKKINPKDRPPSKAGVSSDLVKLLRHQERGWAGAGNQRMIADFARLAQEYDFDLVITGGTEAWVVADLLGRAGASVILTPRTRQDRDESTNRPNGSRIENAAILHRNGVTIGIQPLSSSISLGGIVGRDMLSLPMEAAFAIRGGLPQRAALEAITIGAARLLGVSDRIGSLEPGKDADLIVTDGDLFDYRTFVQYAFVDGKLRYDKAKERFFSRIRARELNPPEVIGEKPAPPGGEKTPPKKPEKHGTPIP